jgi:hypothetical protein
MNAGFAGGAVFLSNSNPLPFWLVFAFCRRLSTILGYVVFRLFHVPFPFPQFATGTTGTPGQNGKYPAFMRVAACPGFA